MSNSTTIIPSALDEKTVSAILDLLAAERSEVFDNEVLPTISLWPRPLRHARADGKHAGIIRAHELVLELWRERNREVRDWQEHEARIREIVREELATSGTDEA